MLSAGKLVIALAAGALPGMAAQDVENLERLREIRIKQLELAREAAAFDDLPKDKAVMAALGRILSESNIDAGEFLRMDARTREAFVDTAVQRVQAQAQSAAQQQAV